MSTKNDAVKSLKKRVKKVLFENILPFWLEYSVDNEQGGFWGRVANEGVPVKNAPKGLILNTRILWTFSALYKKYADPVFIDFANRAYQYTMEKFWDKEYGGMLWLLDYRGSILDDKKKMYGQAFTVYALTEYYKITGDAQVLQKAIEIFRLMEEHNYDNKYTGYLETSNRDWSLAEDMRLSEKDLNVKKSMNTHLHIMEAYTNLYGVWRDDYLKKQLKQIIIDFYEHIWDDETEHLKSFFDEDWSPQSNTVSFGHDIEASWLLMEALDMLDADKLRQKGENVSVRLVNSTIKEGMTPKCGIYKEKTEEGLLLAVTEWWQQAEAAVGFCNAYRLTKDTTYLEFLEKSWRFIEENMVDWKYGEWFYEVNSKGVPNLNNYKVSEWKGPYHNIRACLELISRL